MSAINTNVGKSLMKFTFTDEDGDVLAYFRINPADVRMANRAKKSAQEYENIMNQLPENATADDVIAFDEKLETLICGILGYDAKDSLFGLFSATSIMEDGKIFAACVMEKIYEHVLPEVKKRTDTMEKAAEKYTGKYE